MRNSRLQCSRPINIKDTEVFPRAETKILGVLLDSKLRYKNHIKRISYKGLKAAFALKRMRVLTPSSAHQLFGATVAPVIDYVLSIWMHSLGTSTSKIMRQIQKLNSQAVIGAFSIVVEAIIEAEAFIRPVKVRQWDKTAKLLINLYILSASHPILHLSLQICRKFKSPL